MATSIGKKVGAAIALCIGMHSGAASAADPAAAEALFDAGLEAMQAERFDEACPKIAESFRLEARAGTLFTLAECWRKAGKTATALARYQEYLRVYQRMSADEQAKQRGRQDFARRYEKELEATVPRLTIALAENSPANTTVVRDGIELGKPSLGQALPIDPGEHVIEAHAPGHVTLKRSVTLAPGEQQTVTIELEPAATSSAPTTTPDATTAPPERDRASGSSQRTIGYVALGVGAVGVVVGAVTGALVLGKKSEIEDNCGIGGDPAACNADGKSAADGAQGLATVSTIAFAVGIAGLGAGTALVLTAPSEPSTHGLGLRLTGRF